METARDIFLFVCYTGAAYCDLMELDKSHLVRDDEGSLWLKSTATRQVALVVSNCYPKPYS